MAVRVTVTVHAAQSKWCRQRTAVKSTVRCLSAWLAGRSRAPQSGVGVAELRLVVDREDRVAILVRTRATGDRGAGAPGKTNYGSCL